MNEITIAESKRLLELEAVIDGAKQTFKDVATALYEIRDRKLYRSEFSTFVEYCAKRHGWARDYGYKLAAAGELIKELPENSTMVENERQAREELKKRRQPKVSPVQPTERTTDTQTDNPNAGASEPEPEAPQSVELPHTQDEAWTKAIGVTNVRNFFASQVEDIAESAIADGSVEQLKALVLELQVAVRKVKAAIQAKALATV